MLAVELLSCSINDSTDIVGIKVANKEIKLSQYADDITTFCKDELSLGKLLEMLHLFEECSVLKLNSSKSEAIWLGKNAHKKDELFDFQWPQRPVIALGTSRVSRGGPCSLVPSKIALCSHVPTHFRNLFPFYQIRLPATPPSIFSQIKKKSTDVACDVLFV